MGPAMTKLALDEVLSAQTTELFAEATTPVANATALVEIHDLMAEGAWDAPVELASPTDLGGVESSTQQTALVDQLVQDQIVTV